jgi:hypothetical protein
MTAFVRSIRRSLGIAGGILLVAGVHTASAQLTNPVEFTTTFSFTVGDATVPAGTYTIKPDDIDPGILELSGAHASVLFQTNSAAPRETPTQSEVVFKRYGDDNYVLKDIWLEGSTEGAEVIAVHGEKRAAKHHASATEQRVSATKKTQTAKLR